MKIARAYCRLLFVGLMCLASTASHAYSNDGHSFKAQCAAVAAAINAEETPDHQAMNTCVGRLSSMLNLRTFYCIPEGTLLDDIIVGLHDWLAARPERLTENGNALAIEALAEAYPCREQQ